MSLRILSVAPPLVSLFFFSAFVIAENGIRQDQGVVNVTAKCTSDSFSWVCILWFQQGRYDLWRSSDLIVLYLDFQLN